MLLSPALEKAILKQPSMSGVTTLKGVTHLRCMNGYDYQLTTGKVYEVVDWQEGIFPDRPFVIVRDDEGKEIGAHASRFTPVS